MAVSYPKCHYDNVDNTMNGGVSATPPQPEEPVLTETQEMTDE